MKRFITFLSFTLLFSTLSVFAYATNDKKVTICHSTSSHTNPYIVNSPDKSGDVNGHDGHNGPVWYSGIQVSWGDIIPPFNYGDNNQFYYPGKNWTSEGQAFYNNNCNKPASATPTLTPTLTLTPTPTVTLTPTPTTGQSCPAGQVLNGNFICIVIDCDGGGTCEVNTGNPTPTLTPTVTPTPTTGVQGSTSSSQGDGRSDGKSDGKSTGPTQSVLGSTTMAPTGAFAESLSNAFLSAGILALGFWLVYVGKSKKTN